MNKEFIPYEQELALIKLGYRQSDLLTGYTSEGVLDFTGILYQQAFRWFRKEHGLWSLITKDGYAELNVVYSIWNLDQLAGFKFESKEKSYEEAELACLNQLIEMVKEKVPDLEL